MRPFETLFFLTDCDVQASRPALVKLAYNMAPSLLQYPNRQLFGL